MNSDWVDCKDRMPPCGKFVLAYCAHAPIWSVVRWVGAEWEQFVEESCCRYPNDFYSHWAYLPGPPEKKCEGPFRADKKFCKDCVIYFWDRHNTGRSDSIKVAGISSAMADAVVIWLNSLWADK